MQKNMHTLTAMLALGSISAMTAPGASDGGSSDGRPAANGLDFHDLIPAALGWGQAIILDVQGTDASGPAKLQSAADSFGQALAEQIDNLEARAGVLGAFLNLPGINQIEHALIVKAVEAGSDALEAMLRQAIQTIFTGLKLTGKL